MAFPWNDYSREHERHEREVLPVQKANKGLTMCLCPLKVVKMQLRNSRSLDPGIAPEGGTANKLP